MKSPAQHGTLKIEYRPVGKLKPYAKNARAHPPEQIEAIVRSIKRFGFYAPVLVDSKRGTILKGHGAFQAACQLGMRTVPCTEVGGLSEAEVRALILADNKLAERSGWDKTLLAGELTDLKAMGFDLELTGFSLGEIDDFLKPPPSRDDEPPVPALPKHAVSTIGDVWCLGEHRLACGDATKPATLKALMAGERAQCVFTDPPYGVNYQEGAATTKHPKRFGAIAGDDKQRGELVKLLVAAFGTALQHARDDAAWYVWHASVTRHDFEEAARAVGLVEGANGYIIWAKPPTMGWSHYKSAFEPCFYLHKQGHEPAWYGKKDSSTVWEAAAIAPSGNQVISIGTGVIVATSEGEIYIGPAPKGRKARHVHADRAPALLVGRDDAANLWSISRAREGEDRVHPTQKPVELARRAIRNSTAEGEVVLDLFAGSASTIMGAEHLKRRGYALELDPRYVDVGVRRWQDATGKQATHASSRKTFEATQAERLGKKGTK